MRRTDRLFEIIQLLRSAAAPISAAYIAEQLEVSPRTVYRDIATLQAMRIPIEGAVGVGYVMQRGYDLPPLNFDAVELESIVVGVSLLGRTGDNKLQRAAERVLSKIQLNRTPHDPLRVSDWGIDLSQQEGLAQFRDAIRNEQKLRIQYRSGGGAESDRIILPVVLTYYVEVAVVSAWCELRGDFRRFRTDRILDCQPTEQFFQGRGHHLRRQLDSKYPE